MRHSRLWIGLAAVLIAAGVVAWLLLPALLRHAIHATLASTDYDGTVERIGVDLLDASVTLHEVTLDSSTEGAALRTLTARTVRVDAALWRLLLTRSAIAEVRIVAPEVVVDVPRLVAQRPPALPAFDLDLVIEDGNVRIDSGKGHVVLKALGGRVDGLTNQPGQGPLQAVSSGELEGGGSVAAQATVDLMADPPRGSGKLDVVGLALGAVPLGSTTGTVDAHLRASVVPADGEPPAALVYHGFDLRSLDLDLDLTFADVRTETGDSPDREVVLPEGELSVTWHPDHMRRIELTGWVSHPTVTLIEEGPPGAPGPAAPVSPLAALPPFELKRFEVHGGDLTLVDRTVRPTARVDVHDLDGTLTHLSNEAGKPAELAATGRFAGGQLRIEGQLDPLAEPPKGNLEAHLVDAQLVQLDDLLRAYAHIDASRGTIQAHAVVATANDEVTGHVDVLMDRAEFFDERDWRKGPGALWDALVGLGAEIVQHEPRGRRAVRFELHGRLEQPYTSVWQALLTTILRDSFLRALLPGLTEVSRHEATPYDKGGSSA